VLILTIPPAALSKTSINMMIIMLLVMRISLTLKDYLLDPTPLYVCGFHKPST
jgi:hypothetical protein